MNVPFTIDIWSDVICPYCALGKAHLERALATFDHANDVVIAFHAFELDTHARASYDDSLDELVARKYGLRVDQAASSHQRLECEAAELGLTWSLSTARPGNTFDAHRLIALAESQGRATAMINRLFVAYFSEGVLISDHDQLAALAHEVGVVGAPEFLESDALSESVRADEENALELGISGVPAMMLDGRFLVIGARPAHELGEILGRAWDRRDKIQLEPRA